MTAEQYEEFYRTTFKAYDKPLTLSHFSLEGQVEFRALLYVPGQLPFELVCASVFRYIHIICTSMYMCIYMYTCIYL